MLVMLRMKSPRLLNLIVPSNTSDYAKYSHYYPCFTDEKIKLWWWLRNLPLAIQQFLDRHGTIGISESRSVVSNSLWPHWLYNPWNSLGQNTGVGSLSLLQGIFSTQGLNQGLLHCRWILCQLSHKGSPATRDIRHIWVQNLQPTQ